MLHIKNLRSEFFGPVDLEVAAGECVAIRGASGAGKSLLLRAVADLDPNDGKIWWHRRARNEMPAPEWRRLVALVPAESGWWTDRVAEHFATLSGTAELLDAVGIAGEAMTWDVARLSTGERHRLAIARALALTPSVLLLDEPTAALDGDATIMIEGLVKHQLDTGAAVILVTHDLDQAKRLASRTAIMKNGQLLPSESVP